MRYCYLVLFLACLLSVVVITAVLASRSSSHVRPQVEIDRLDSLLPLSDAPILDINPRWREYIRSHHQVFLEEYDAFASKFTVAHHRDNVGGYASSIDKYDKWNSIVLRLFDHDTKFAQMFPNTMRVLNSAGEHIPSIIFSTLAPGAVLDPHRGVTKSVLRYHLGLRVPRDFNECYISLWDESGEEFRHSWEDGRDIVFDDNYLHGVQNRTEEPRTVLFLDVRRSYVDSQHQKIRDRLLRLGRKTVRHNEINNINAVYSKLVQ